MTLKGFRLAERSGVEVDQMFREDTALYGTQVVKCVPYKTKRPTSQVSKKERGSVAFNINIMQYNGTQHVEEFILS